MKKIIICLLLCTMSAILLFGTNKINEKSVKNLQDEVFRIHIRANSNLDCDQAVKYKVKKVLTDFITPLLVNAINKEKAMAIIEANLNKITNIAIRTLSEQGFSYGASARISKEEFPTRNYNGKTFPSGEYDALLVELGDANGDNWWCVVYPPLCFVNGYDTNGDRIIYQSKLKEIIEIFFND